jgi:pimeloyl-ACP methyl ester carboxylesterase
VDPEPGLQRLALSTGVHLAYTEQGDRSGPAVLLLHGWLESARSFDRLRPLLPSSLRVIAVDQRGHGRSDAPMGGYDVDSLAADVEAFVAALGLHRVVLVGSSSGGYVAEQVAVRCPDRIAGLALVGSPFTLMGRPDFAAEVDRLTDPVDPSWVRVFLDAFPRFSVIPQWYLDQRVQESADVPARVWRQSLTGLTTSRPPLESGAVTAPTLILWGDQDSVLDRAGQVDLADAIPGSRLYVYKGVGHLVLWEIPEQVASDLVEFVDALAR